MLGHARADKPKVTSVSTKLRRKTRQARRGIVIPMLVAWAIQLGALGYFFANLTWDRYWSLRWLYRPGLRLFEMLFGGLLPGHFFSPIDRTGVLSGFAFASLLYACLAVCTALLLPRLLMMKR